MMPLARHIALAVLLLAATPGAARAEAALATPPGECITDWGVAGAIVRTEKLMSVQELTQSLAADGVGKLIKTTLCRDGAGYVYRLVVQDRFGQLKTSVIPAKAR